MLRWIVSLPALATEIVCCSIASCIMARSSVLMLANSSIQHTPSFESTKAPASNEKSVPSRTHVQVRPAPVVPIPVVKTLLATTEAAKRSIWLFPKRAWYGWVLLGRVYIYMSCMRVQIPAPGSPTSNRWLWLRLFTPPSCCVSEPPTRVSNKASLT